MALIFSPRDKSISTTQDLKNLQFALDQPANMAKSRFLDNRQLIELMGGTFGLQSQPGDALQAKFAIESIATREHSTGANAINDE